MTRTIAKLRSRFGIPPYMKRFMEDKALDAMGENKASFGTKSFIDKLPETDDEVRLCCDNVFRSRSTLADEYM